MLIRCCRNSLKGAPGYPDAGEGRGLPQPSPISIVTSERLHADLAVGDFDQIDVGLALAAFLAFRTRFPEYDVAVQALDVDIPQRRLDRCRLRLACLLDRGCRGADTVIATETLGAAGEVEAALLPLGDEVVGRFRVRRLVGEPGQEGRQVHGAVGGGTRLRDDLVRILRAAGGDDALLEA